VKAAVGDALSGAVTGARRIAGGDINEAYEIALADGRRLFAKTNRRSPRGMFAAEARGLAWLAEPRALRVPEVVAASSEDTGPQFLVLELVTTGAPAPDFDQRLGRGLAALHRAGAPGFGLDHDNFVEQVAAAFASLSASSSEKIARPNPPQTFPHITLKNKKSLEQVQFCLAVPAPPVADPARYTAYLLNSILGGGMSSRLFQSIREDRGLAYSIYSELNPFRDTGTLAVYAGCAASNVEQVLQLTLAECTRIKHEPVTDEELDRAKNQIKGNMVLGLETSGSRMSSLARQQMYWGRFFSLDEITAEIDRVTPADIQSLANTLLHPDLLALTLLGNLGPLKLTRANLTC